MYIYSKLLGHVAWNRSYSHDIKILNGVRQGACSTEFCFVLYSFCCNLYTPWSQLNIGAILVSVSLVYLRMLTTWCYGA